jgi:ribosome-associated protein
MKELKLEGEFIPLCDLMKVTDLTASGGEAKHLIADGKVLVDGVVETRKRCKIRRDQVIEYNGQKVRVV